MGTNGASPGIGLRAWNGDGAIRVYRDLVTDDAVLLLLERCKPGQTLETQVPDVEQHEIVAGLLTRLWRHPGDGLGVRPLQDMCDAWADEFDEKLAADPRHIDPGLARDGMELFRSLPSTANREALLCTDLHASNVLSAQREPWSDFDLREVAVEPAI